MAEDRPADCGSKKVANPSPIVMPHSSPASSTAVKSMRTAKPIATQMMNCCASTSTPPNDIGSMAGTGPSADATIAPKSSRRATLSRTGMPVLPNSGATAIMPMMRVNGHMKLAIIALGLRLFSYLDI